MLAHLDPMLAHLGAMLAQLGHFFRLIVGPCWPILSHKAGKMQEAENTVKRGTAHGPSRGRRQGRDSTLSFGEERRLRQGHGQRAPGRILRIARQAAAAAAAELNSR